MSNDADYDFGTNGLFNTGNADLGYGPTGTDNWANPGMYSAPGGNSLWDSITGAGGDVAKWAKDNPSLVAALLGAAGPAAGLLGSLASGGQGPTTSGTSSRTSSGTQSGTRTSQSSDVQSAYGNRSEQATLDPAAQQAMDRLTAMLSGNQAGAQGAYGDALGMMRQLAQGQMGQMTNGSGASALGGPPTMGQADPVTGFPKAPPTAYNAGLGNLIKQAFGSFVGDLGAGAITNARNRGFSGGGDLLNSAAAPMMGQTLAQVPGMEAKAYLDHVLQAYGLESENAGRENAARAASRNAATNAMGPGVQKYGYDVQKYGMDRQADNAQLGQMTSLLQALMGPQRDLMTANTNLLNAAPRGRLETSLSGSTRNLSGSEASQSSSSGTESGQTTGSSQTPMGTVVGQGLSNIFQGVGVGLAGQASRDQAQKNHETLLAALAARK